MKKQKQGVLGDRQFSLAVRRQDQMAYLGSILSIRENTPTLSGLSPERASDNIQSRSANGERMAAVREERASRDGRGLMASSLCSTMRM
jgi:hypothetical protein